MWMEITVMGIFGRRDDIRMEDGQNTSGDYEKKRTAAGTDVWREEQGVVDESQMR